MAAPGTPGDGADTDLARAFAVFCDAIAGACEAEAALQGSAGDPSDAVALDAALARAEAARAALRDAATVLGAVASADDPLDGALVALAWEALALLLAPTPEAEAAAQARIVACARAVWRDWRLPPRQRGRILAAAAGLGLYGRLAEGAAPLSRPAVAPDAG